MSFSSRRAITSLACCFSTRWTRWRPAGETCGTMPGGDEKRGGEGAYDPGPDRRGGPAEGNDQGMVRHSALLRAVFEPRRHLRRHPAISENLKPGQLP